MKLKRKSTWLKNRGYLHLTRQIDVSKERGEILGKVKNETFVRKHAFFPLLHVNIKVRRYKLGKGENKRSHSVEGKTHAKLRPLHYATHIDSMIFGYYGELLQNAYLKELDKTEHLSKCVTAYRRIEHPERKNSYKSTIHFAHEVFEEIKSRSDLGCWVLKFDIEKFFSSMDHKLLKIAWAKLIDKPTLPDDHYNVFKAATQFSYILRDDLRINPGFNGRRSGFDERNLAEIRKHNITAFFESGESFRKALKEGKFRVYRNQFRNSEQQVVGIPQGLPISATLANLYLMEFDKCILEEVVVKMGGYYRRYSDDIIIICKDEEQKDFIINYVDQTLRKDSKVEVSIEKTEQFFFVEVEEVGESKKVVSYLHTNDNWLVGRPLTYLGFEFYGDKTLIKSANLSKFYRRMINAVKSRSKRAILAASKNPGAPTALFRRRLYRLYTNINLDKTKTNRNYKQLVPNRFGYYLYETEQGENDFRSNYFTYGKRAASIMNEQGIIKQVRRHRTIFNQAIKKHFSQL